MAKIKLRPIEPLEIEFNDGTIKTALFNNEAFLLYDEEFGDITKSINEEIKTSPYSAMAKILYSAIKVTDPEFTLDEALQIMYMGGSDLLFTISQALIENFNLNSNEEVKKKYQEHLKKTLKKEDLQLLKDLKLL